VFKQLRKIILPMSAGLILYCAFRYDIWLLTILAISIFYRRLVDQPLQKRLLVTFGFTVGFFVPHLWWISVLGYDALLLLSLLCIVLFALIAFLPLHSNNFWSKLEFASTWALIELVRSHYPWGGFGWGLLGYSQTTGPLVQYSRYANVALVAFVVVLIAAMVSDFRILNPNIFMKSKELLLVITLLIIGVVLPAPQTNGVFKVGVVQGGVVPAFVPESIRASQVFANHLRQTQAHADLLRNSDLVVWPENSVNLQEASGIVSPQIQAVVDQIGKPFLVGVVRTNQDGQPENAVLLWLPKTGITSSYVKNHLVPFGEYIPMRNLLAARVGRLDQIPADFTKGVGGGVSEVAGTRVGVAICFEVADQMHLTNLVDDGAQVLIAASNNATYLGTLQPAQQFQISKFSAIAHQRSMVVATTTGVSGVISASGNISYQVTDSGASVFVAEAELSNSVAVTDRYPMCRYLFVSVFFMTVLTRRARARFKKLNADRLAV